MATRAVGSVRKKLDSIAERTLQRGYPEFTWYPWLFKGHALSRNFWYRRKNQERYFDWLAEVMDIKTSNCWLQHSKKTVFGQQEHLRTMYNSNITAALQAVYPQFVWTTDDTATALQKRALLDSVAQKLNVHKYEQWHLIKVTEFVSAHKGAAALLLAHQTIPSILQTVYSEYDWYVWLFAGSAAYRWNNSKHHKEYLNWLSYELQIETSEDWYGVSPALINSYAGAGLLKQYNNSVCVALQSTYAQYDWKHWLFQKVPSLAWHNLNSLTQYFDWLAYLLQIETSEEWYSVTQEDFKCSGGEAILATFKGRALEKALQRVYPQFEWLPWRFDRVPSNYWADYSNQLKCFEWLSEQLQIRDIEDWYDVTRNQVLAVGGGGLLAQYNWSISSMVSHFYPEHEFIPWKFERAPAGYWNYLQHQRDCFDMLAAKFNIQHPKQWLRVTHRAIVDNGAGGLLSHYEGSLIQALQSIYHEYDWSLLKHASEGQSYVQQVLSSMLQCDVLANYRHPHLYFAQTGQKIELDLYVPTLELAFEYQGAEHYTNSSKLTLSTQTRRDDEKRALCRAAGISLIEVPYWWDCSKSTLYSTIIRHRSDLAPVLQFEVTNAEAIN